MRYTKYLIIVAFCFVSFTDIFGQVRPRKRIDNSQNTNQTFGQNTGVFQDTMNRDSLFTKSELEGPDTTIYNYYFLDNLDELTPFDDTSNYDLHRYNPVQFEGDDHLYLGNVGSSAIPIRYNPIKDVGLDFGFRQYDIYNIRLQDLKFYRVNRALNDLSYTPVGGQGNFIVKGKFYRNFANNTFLHIDYTRYLQEGFYTDQNTKTTNLAMTVDFQPNKGKYRGFISLVNNNNNEEHNGGVTDTTLYNNDFYGIRFRIPTRLFNAARRHQSQQIAYNQFVKLDSLLPGFKVVFRNQLSFDRGYYKYADTDVSVDSTYYGPFWQEDRGLRNYISYNIYGADFHMQLSNAERFKWSNGLVFKYYDIDEEAQTTSQKSLIYQSTFSSRIANRFSLTANGQLGLWDFAGDFKLGGMLKWKANESFLNISVGADAYNYTPTIEQQRIFANEIQVWNNDFDNTFGTRINGRLEIPKFNFSVALSQTVENNSIYRNQDGSPGQLEDILSTQELNIRHLLSWSVLRFKNDFLIQAFSDDRIIRPTYLSRHSLYFENLLFNNNLDIQIGLDYTHMNEYRGLAFSPFNGQFVPSNNPVAFYPLLDGFVNTKIDQFRVFFKFENIASFFLDQNINYHIEDYPLFDFKFRMGIRWLLKD